jgi:hypothetical protein
MGAWGPGSFDNDAAADWVLECARTGDFALVEATLDNLLAAEADELDAADAEEAIAAAEAVARAAGRWGVRNAYSKALDDWIERPGKPPAALLAKAHQAVHRIRNAPSELRELWSDSDGFAEWRASLDGLLTRLGE